MPKIHYKTLLWLLPLLGCLNNVATAQKFNTTRTQPLVRIKTSFGDLHLVLFDATPLHKAKFLELTKKGFYDGLLFHRIIEGFMIQGGDPTSRGAKPGAKLGDGGDSLGLIPAEFRPELFHKKGVIAAARDNNPAKSSSACQFYIVQGKVWDEGGFQTQAARSKKTYTEAQKRTYQTLGGSPHLDNSYTVYGEVIDGLAVIDSIAKQPRDSLNRPLADIAMQVSVQKMRKKKITKRFGYIFE